MTMQISVGRGCATIVIGLGFGILSASPSFAQGTPERNVYFGQTHVHTSWSFDAYVFGNTLAGPDEAYKYALGQPVKHPGGYTVQLKHPLDFQAVTDHAEYAGTVRLANEPGSAVSKLPVADKLKVRSQEDIQKVYLFLGDSMLKNQPIKELLDPEVAGNVWKQTVAIADKCIVVDTVEGHYTFDSIYPALGSDTHTQLGEMVGAKLAPDGCFLCDSHQRTSIRGLYAAGDVVHGLDQISHAMGEGGVAATTIRNDLAKGRPLLR